MCSFCLEILQFKISLLRKGKQSWKQIFAIFYSYIQDQKSRVFANGPGFSPRSSHTKDLKNGTSYLFT